MLLSITDTIPAVTRLDAITPTSVIATMVTTNPAPGMERWRSPSMRWKSAQHTQSVTATGAVTTSPRRKYAISFRMLVECVRGPVGASGSTTRRATFRG